MARVITGLDVLRTADEISDRTNRPLSDAEHRAQIAKTLRLSSKSVDLFYDIVDHAAWIFHDLGPRAGISDVAAESGLSRCLVSQWFLDDHDLRLAYKYWAFGEPIASLTCSFDRFENGLRLDSTNASALYWLSEMWAIFFDHGIHVCQFHDASEIDAELRTRLISVTKHWLDIGRRGKVFHFANLNDAAAVCADVWSARHNEAEWKRMELAHHAGFETPADRDRRWFAMLEGKRSKAWARDLPKLQDALGLARTKASWRPTEAPVLAAVP